MSPCLNEQRAQMRHVAQVWVLVATVGPPQLYSLSPFLCETVESMEVHVCIFSSHPYCRLAWDSTEPETWLGVWWYAVAPVSCTTQPKLRSRPSSSRGVLLDCLRGLGAYFEDPWPGAAQDSSLKDRSVTRKLVGQSMNHPAVFVWFDVAGCQV